MSDPTLTPDPAPPTLPAGLLPPTSPAAMVSDLKVLFDPANASFRDAALNALGSKKWLVLILTLIGCFTLVFTHHATWAEVKETVLAIVVAYFGTQGFVEAARHTAMGKVAGAKSPTVNLSVR